MFDRQRAAGVQRVLERQAMVGLCREVVQRAPGVTDDPLLLGRDLSHGLARAEYRPMRGVD